uniref:Uncharacterized protein ycf23 n=1 Tax=Hommersandiophycus borowitzkae TaxID=268573 RepID=A0A1G4NTY2_9FLOR|nr:Hypothetical protein ycf23 [Hommersandiophycus borowitzkae]SCW22120.1 Hypothetical protein ycf23 [Hommersandiophycus borowitzkae]
MVLHDIINEACDNRNLLKVIIGIDNFNLLKSIPTIKAAEIGEASYVDIAANIDFVVTLKSLLTIPVCVSSICIRELEACYLAGADILEIGNFDVFYRKNIYLTPRQIFNMSRELKLRLPHVPLCVTIPHNLNFHNQLVLGRNLQDIGVDMVQTEGVSSKLIDVSNVSQALKYASATLCSTSVLSNMLKIPVMSSSGITPLTAPIAISCGASGIGMGSFFNTNQSALDLSKEVSEIMYSLKKKTDPSIHCLHNYELAKDSRSILSDLYVL